MGNDLTVVRITEQDSYAPPNGAIRFYLRRSDLYFNFWPRSKTATAYIDEADPSGTSNHLSRLGQSFMPGFHVGLRCIENLAHTFPGCDAQPRLFMPPGP